MTNPLFSTYSQGENRVTATILAVFERISFGLVEQILQGVLEEPETQLVTFENQPAGPRSVPDARIGASFAYWLETKIRPNEVRASQIRGHLLALDGENPRPERQRLIVLTPDDRPPAGLDDIDDGRVVWANFSMLVDAVEATLEIGGQWLTSNQPLATENERVLLRELVRFLSRERLLQGAESRVVVVAARIAYGDYKTYGFYFCQPNRSFQSSAHLGFYHQGRIMPELPRIRHVVESVNLDPADVSRLSRISAEQRARLLAVLAQMERAGDSRLGDPHGLFFLSPADDPETIHLPQPIENDLVADTGRAIGFTQGQRYVSLAAIKQGPATTSQLLKLEEELRGK